MREPWSLLVPSTANEDMKQTRSVSPAYTKRDVATLKSPFTIAHPKNGHAIILETVRRFGIVYMFSRRASFGCSGVLTDVGLGGGMLDEKVRVLGSLWSRGLKRGTFLVGLRRELTRNERERRHDDEQKREDMQSAERLNDAVIDARLSAFRHCSFASFRTTMASTVLSIATRQGHCSHYHHIDFQ